MKSQIKAEITRIKLADPLILSGFFLLRLPIRTVLEENDAHIWYGDNHMDHNSRLTFDNHVELPPLFPSPPFPPPYILGDRVAFNIFGEIRIRAALTGRR